MGLTLNSNSLTLESAGGGGGSGLTQAQVDARVEANTDYKHLGTLTANNSSELVFTGFDRGYNTLKLIVDGLEIATAILRMSVYLDGATISNELYSQALDVQNGGSISSSGGTSNGMWSLTQVWDPNGGMTGQIILSNASDNSKTPIFTSYLTGNQGNNALRFDVGGNLHTNYTGEVTGIRLFPSTSNFASGKVYLYGLNKND